MVAATTLKARLTGNLVEKPEDVVKREAMERINAERKETVGIREDIEVIEVADLLASVDVEKRSLVPLELSPAPVVPFLLSVNTQGLSAFSARSIPIRACIRKSRASAVSIRQ